jgi:hypothetical protein
MIIEGGGIFVKGDIPTLAIDLKEQVWDNVPSKNVEFGPLAQLAEQMTFNH